MLPRKYLTSCDTIISKSNVRHKQTNHQTTSHKPPPPEPPHPCKRSNLEIYLIGAEKKIRGEVTKIWPGNYKYYMIYVCHVFKTMKKLLSYLKCSSKKYSSRLLIIVWNVMERPNELRKYEVAKILELIRQV